MRLRVSLTVLFIACGVATAEPPKVQKASPDNGATAVDPATAEIRVVFDQAMDTRGYSVVGGGPAFPELIGKPKWVGDRTLVAAVRLQPDHDYSLSINSDRFTFCRNKAGEPATPYAIAFSTGPAKGAEPAANVIARNRDAITELRRAIDQDYSYRDLRNVDWDAQFKDVTPRLERAGTPAGFANGAVALLGHAKDIHIWLKVGDTVIVTHRLQVTPNFNPKVLPRLVPHLQQHGTTALTGKMDDGTVYVAVGTWEAKEPAALDAVLAAVRDAIDSKARAIIVDVRVNTGGDELLARKLAALFVDAPKVYSKHTTRSGGKWSPVHDRAVAPAEGQPCFRGKVVVLMGPANMSSCESFLLMMRQAPECTLVGGRSYGGSGNPKPHDLGNGVTVFLPSWKNLSADGTELEGKGVEPDVVVRTTPADFADSDPVLEAALNLLRQDSAKPAVPF